MAELDGRTAFITGGGQGIGRGVALELARAGANVVVTQRKIGPAEAVVAEILALGAEAIALSVDVADEASVNRGAQAAFARFPQIDIVINNAGTGPVHRAEDTDLADFDHCYTVNLRGAWAVARAFIPHFKARQSGKIINIASIDGRVGVEFPAYCSSKAALISLTQSLARLLGPNNINVNAVCPGPVWTTLHEHTLRKLVETGQFPADQVNEAEFFQSYANQISMRRVATPQDIGHAVAFLVSERARSITGQALNVDCGMVMN